jgi:eukaryotic-like serine/threonine-protein kinase
MKADNWQQINDLFHAALDQEPGERAAFIADACAGDEGLRSEVESLLASHDPSDNFIESLAPDLAAGLLAESHARLATGQSVGNYRVMALLGAGGMGEVYLTEDTRLGRRVALKLLPEQFTTEPDRLHRFEREARAASTLNHPNIITIHEVGQVEGEPFIITEFIEGKTLRQQMAAAKMMLREALDVAIQVASALEAAHKAGIVHRDIKPENIMLRPDGLVKVLDFGLAKLTEAQAPGPGAEATTLASVQTKTGLVMGTVTYMSPEQARGLAVDARSDIFTLGTVIYEMIAGQVPFAGATTSDVIVSILEREPAPLSPHELGVPAELERIVKKALAKDREERYQLARDLLIDLRNLKQEIELQAKLDVVRPAELKGATPAGLRVSVDTDERLTTRSTDAEVTLTARTTSSAEVILSEIGRHKTSATVSLLVLLLVVAGIGYGLYRFLGQPKPEAGPLQTTKMTKLIASGKARDAAISPDGKHVVYVEEEAKQQSLWISQVATGSHVQIVPPAQVFYLGLTFSKDLNYVYYTRTSKDDPRDPRAALYRVSSLGGTSTKLIEYLDSAVAFSPDGQRFAFLRAKSRKETSLLIANADGSGERTIATRMAPEFFVTEGLVRIGWSPDGKIVACPTGDNTKNFYGVVGVSVEDGSEKPLTSQKLPYVAQVAWLSGGSGLAMLAIAPDERKSPQQLWRLSYPGGELRRITNDLNSYTSLSLTEDSNALVTVQSNQSSRIWIAPKGDAVNARQISSGAEDGSGGLCWTPEGRIVYQSRTGGDGRSNIWVMNADGSNQRQLTYEGGITPSVSSDGRYIVFASWGRADTMNIWRVDIDGGNQRQLTDGKSNGMPCVSRDGRWVVYASWELGLWKVPIDGGTSVFLSDSNSMWPVVSPDGTQIACFYADDKANPSDGTMLLSFEGGQPAKRLKTLYINFPLRWTPDGRALMYIDTYRSNIWSQPVDGGSPVQLTTLQGDQLFHFDYSPDGKWLALARGRVTADVVLISNFK